MVNGSCFTILNSEETKSVLSWAKKHGESRILHGEGEVELLSKINLVLEKNPEMETLAQFTEGEEVLEVESGS